MIAIYHQIFIHIRFHMFNLNIKKYSKFFKNCNKLWIHFLKRMEDHKPFILIYTQNYKVQFKQLQLIQAFDSTLVHMYIFVLF